MDIGTRLLNVQVVVRTPNEIALRPPVAAGCTPLHRDLVKLPRAPPRPVTDGLSDLPVDRRDVRNVGAGERRPSVAG
jgi:hypothetical protein